MLKNKSMLFLCFLPLLAGCAGYHALPLKKMNTVPLAKHKDIAFAAQAFDKDDCEIYLGRNVIDAGYTPIQIAIENNSHKSLQFSCDQLNMPLASTNIVAESVYQSSWARALGYGIPGASNIGLGAFFLALNFHHGWNAMMIYVIAPLMVGGGLALLVAGLLDASCANSANKQLLADYLDKALKDQIILPHTSVDGLVFVRNDQLEERLIVNLFDDATHQKIMCQKLLQ